MKFENRQPGTSTSFVDSESNESLLEISADADGLALVAFHLYDSSGSLVDERTSPENFPDGVTICSSEGETLLSVPKEGCTNIQYRLYNHDGLLLTTSDGVRTKIYPRLRMEASGRSWVGRRKT